MGREQVGPLPPHVDRGFWSYWTYESVRFAGGSAW